MQFIFFKFDLLIQLYVIITAFRRYVTGSFKFSCHDSICQLKGQLEDPNESSQGTFLFPRLLYIKYWQLPYSATSYDQVACLRVIASNPFQTSFTLFLE